MQHDKYFCFEWKNSKIWEISKTFIIIAGDLYKIHIIKVYMGYMGLQLIWHFHWLRHPWQLVPVYPPSRNRVALFENLGEKRSQGKHTSLLSFLKHAFWKPHSHCKITSFYCKVKPLLSGVLFSCIQLFPSRTWWKFIQYSFSFKVLKLSMQKRQQ